MQRGLLMTCAGRLRRLSTVALLSALALVPTARHAAAACTIDTLASLPLERADGHLTTTIAIGGRPVRLLVDTGAALTTLDRTTAARLGLGTQSRAPAALTGIGGAAPSAGRLTPTTVQLGDWRLAEMPLGVADLTTGRPGAPLAGILGLDLLGRAELEIDVPRHRLVLHRAAGCTGRFLDWTEPYQALPLTPVSGPLTATAVAIDGVALMALVDTGATQSVLFAPALRRLGPRAAPLPTDRRGFGLGVAGRRVPAILHAFHAVRLGEETIAAPTLAMVRQSPLSLDMILGLDLLGRRRFWLSTTTRQLFVALP